MSALEKVLAPIIQWKWMGASAVGCHRAPPASDPVAPSPPPDPEPPSPPEPEPPLDDELPVPELEPDPEPDPEPPEPPESPDALTSELASDVDGADPPDEPHAHHHARALNVNKAVRVPFTITPLTDTFR
ncbi:MAG TPA: hypothetical protein VMI75_02375 [Polyangiaceae bacterium]|nr:hypothetical protein [Polyangiaceae bacterium]